jgi:hypothetical protein
MTIQDWKIITFGDGYLRFDSIEYNQPEKPNQLCINNLAFEEFFLENNINDTLKRLTTKEQIYINDKISQWFKIAKQCDEAKKTILLFDGNLMALSNIKEIFFNAEKLGIRVNENIFSDKESSRQSVIGSRYDISELKTNSQTVHIDLQHEKIIVSVANNHRLEIVSELNFGVKDLYSFIKTSGSTVDLMALASFVNGNLTPLVEEIECFGKPTFITLDVASTRLLKSLCDDTDKLDKLNINQILAIKNDLIESDFLLFSGESFERSPEINYYMASKTFLLTSLIQLLGVHSCWMDENVRQKGYILHYLLKSGYINNHLTVHQMDCQNSLDEIILKYSPRQISRCNQLVRLTMQIYDSMEDIAGSSDLGNRQIVKIAAQLWFVLSRLEESLAKCIINEVYDISQSDCEIIYTIVRLTQITQNHHQIGWLDHVPVQSRLFTRKMSAVINLARSLDVTGRSAINHVEITHSQDSNNELSIKIFPRMDYNPEMIKLISLKRSLEQGLEHKLNIVVN